MKLTKSNNSKKAIPNSFHNFPKENIQICNSRNVIVLKNNVVLSSLLIKEASIFDNLPFNHWLKTYKWTYLSFFKNITGIKVIRNEKNYFHIFNMWSNGYHHWITEVAPKLFLYEEELRNGIILVPLNSPKFIIEFLNLFGFKNLLFFNSPMFLKRLNIIENTYSGHYSSEFLTLFKKKVKKKIETNGDELKIYVSRRKSKNRRIVNEEEIINYLIHQKFEIIDSEDLDFIDQVKLFSLCNILLSIHGAALTNLIFMKPGTQVIELFPEINITNNEFNSCYYRLSSAMKINHEYLFCKFEGGVNNLKLNTVNLTVDLNKLKEKLEING